MHPGFEIGWVTTMKVCLKYGDTLIGKITMPDTPMILDDENNMETSWDEYNEPEMEIKKHASIQVFPSGRYAKEGCRYTARKPEEYDR